MKNVGVFVGRMCPPTLGHTKVIDIMINDCGWENSIIFIGSSVTPLSWRILFSYYDRVRWLKRIYGKQLKVVGMPDVLAGDSQWLEMLDDYLYAIFPDVNKKDIIYYGGKQEDVAFFYTHGRNNVKIVDRNELPISATQVREMLLLNMDISSVVDSRIAKEVKEVFHKQLKKLDQLRSE